MLVSFEHYIKYYSYMGVRAGKPINSNSKEVEIENIEVNRNIQDIIKANSKKKTHDEIIRILNSYRTDLEDLQAIEKNILIRVNNMFINQKKDCDFYLKLGNFLNETSKDFNRLIFHKKQLNNFLKWVIKGK